MGSQNCMSVIPLPTIFLEMVRQTLIAHLSDLFLDHSAKIRACLFPSHLAFEWAVEKIPRAYTALTPILDDDELAVHCCWFLPSCSSCVYSFVILSITLLSFTYRRTISQIRSSDSSVSQLYGASIWMFCILLQLECPTNERTRFIA